MPSAGVNSSYHIVSALHQSKSPLQAVFVVRDRGLDPAAIIEQLEYTQAYRSQYNRGDENNQHLQDCRGAAPCTQAPGEQFSQANLAPVQRSSRDQRLLRDHESAGEEKDETRSGNEEKKEPRGHKQDTANN